MKKILLLLTVILMDFLVGMEFDIFVPSFPELKSHFGLTPFWVEATLSVNFIGLCISLFFVGNLADRFGRRPVILGGLIAFTLGSILCLFAPHFIFLLLGRFLQGTGIAAPCILSFLLIADTFELKKQQYYMAMLNGIMNISCALAPILGSYITIYFHWQGNFTALLLLGLFVLIMTLLFVPKHTPEEKKEEIGYIQLLQIKPYLMLIIQITLMFVPWWIFVGITPLLYIQDLGVGLHHFGYYQGSIAFLFAIGSVTYGFVMNRFDKRKMLHYSNITFIISLVLLSFLTIINCENPLFITLVFSLFILGQIIPTTILFPYTLNYLPEAKGRTAALIQAGRLIFSALGLQLAGHYYTGSFQNPGIILCLFIFATIVALQVVMQKQVATNSELA